MERAYWAAVVALLAAMGCVQVTSVLGENQTHDEALHLAAGYSYLKTGDMRLNQEHPPLGKLLAALPVLALGPRLPLEHPSWEQSDGFEFGRVFLYENRLPADTLLLAGRLPTIGLSLVLAALVAWWARRHFGPAAALAAVFLCCLDPNVVAHGRYVTTDLIVALTGFAACLAWARFLETRRIWSLACAGLLLGLALASKFSALYLLGIFPLLYLAQWWRERSKSGRRRHSWRHLWLSTVLAWVIATLVLALAYWPETARMLSGGSMPRLAEAPQPSGELGRLEYDIGRKLNLPAHAYLKGLLMHAEHEDFGHLAYLMGKQSQTGWWHYFPIAFAVKTPTAVLLLAAAVLAGALWRVREVARGLPMQWAVLVLPPVAYFWLSMTSQINLGIRHLLPIYPFLFVLLPAAALRLGAGLPRKVLLTLALLGAGIQVFESARTYPHYLAFFNTPAGGGENGARWLLNSNLDWGQDLKKLKRYMDRHGLKDVCLAYFGTADVGYYGIRERSVPPSDDPYGQQEANCVAAVSATVLYGAYVPEETYAWLRPREPVEKIGYSIYVYDLRKQPVAGR